MSSASQMAVKNGGNSSSFHETAKIPNGYSMVANAVGANSLKKGIWNQDAASYNRNGQRLTFGQQVAKFATLSGPQRVGQILKYDGAMSMLKNENMAAGEFSISCQKDINSSKAGGLLRNYYDTLMQDDQQSQPQNMKNSLTTSMLQRAVMNASAPAVQMFRPTYMGGRRALAVQMMASDAKEPGLVGYGVLAATVLGFTFF